MKVNLNIKDVVEWLDIQWENFVWNKYGGTLQETNVIQNDLKKYMKYLNKKTKIEVEKKRYKSQGKTIKKKWNK